MFTLYKTLVFTMEENSITGTFPLPTSPNDPINKYINEYKALYKPIDAFPGTISNSLVRFILEGMIQTLESKSSGQKDKRQRINGGAIVTGPRGGKYIVNGKNIKRYIRN